MLRRSSRKPWPKPSPSLNFDRLVLRRYDATIAFDWGHAPPARGLPTEYFPVRWAGWLVPPVSGRYTFRATVNDGIRTWLNDQSVMDEWRPQPVRPFSSTIERKAGEPPTSVLPT